MEKLLEETIKAGLEIGALKKASISKLNVDTTVQEKAIRFPTDANLYHCMREKLVDMSKEHGVKLRQSYKFKSKRSVENAIGLVRRFLPKKTDFTKLSPKEISSIEYHLNNRPHKSLNYKTSLQVFNSCVALAR